MKKEILHYEMPDSWLCFNDKKTLLCEIIETCLYFCIIYPLSAFAIFFYSSDKLLVYKSLIIFPIMLVTTLVNVKIRALSLFLLLNLSVIALSFFLGSIVLQKIIFLTIAVSCFILSLKKRVNLSRNILKPMEFVLCTFFLGVLYFLSIWAKLNFISNIIMIFALIFAIGCMVYIHVTRANKLSDWEQKYTNETEDKIHKFSSIFIAGIVIILLFSLGLAYELRLFDAARSMDNKLISFFSDTNTKTSQNVELPNMKASKQESFEKPSILKQFDKDTKPSPFWEILSKILGPLAFFVVLGLIFLVLKAFYFNFYDKHGNENEKREFTFSKDEILERAKESFEKISRKIMDPLDLSNRRKIRKLYHKAILNYINKQTQITASNSANEIAAKIKNNCNKDIKDITGIYEKARYGKSECTDEEVNKVKQLLNLKK